MTHIGQRLQWMPLMGQYKYTAALMMSSLLLRIQLPSQLCALSVQNVPRVSFRGGVIGYIRSGTIFGPGLREYGIFLGPLVVQNQSTGPAGSIPPGP